MSTDDVRKILVAGELTWSERTQEVSTDQRNEGYDPFPTGAKASYLAGTHTIEKYLWSAAHPSFPREYECNAKVDWETKPQDFKPRMLNRNDLYDQLVDVIGVSRADETERRKIKKNSSAFKSDRYTIAKIERKGVAGASFEAKVVGASKYTFPATKPDIYVPEAEGDFDAVVNLGSGYFFSDLYCEKDRPTRRRVLKAGFSNLFRVRNRARFLTLKYAYDGSKKSNSLTNANINIAKLMKKRDETNKHTIAVLSAGALRRSGLVISKEMSWESTVHETLLRVKEQRQNALDRDGYDKNPYISIFKAKYVVIVFSLAGALLVEFKSKSSEVEQALLIATTTEIEGDLERKFPGGLRGKESCVAAAIAFALSQLGSHDEVNKLMHEAAPGQALAPEEDELVWEQLAVGVANGVRAMRFEHVRGLTNLPQFLSGDRNLSTIFLGVPPSHRLLLSRPFDVVGHIMRDRTKLTGARYDRNVFPSMARLGSCMEDIFTIDTPTDLAKDPDGIMRRFLRKAAATVQASWDAAYGVSMVPVPIDCDLTRSSFLYEAVLGHLQAVASAPDNPRGRAWELGGIQNREGYKYAYDMHGSDVLIDFAADILAGKLDTSKGFWYLDENKPCPQSNAVLRGRTLPLGLFGQLTSFDRAEIEQLRELRGQLFEYASQADSHAFSFFVLGEPGSGKTFLLRSLLDAVNHPLIDTDLIDLNLSSIESRDDLFQAFHRSRDRSLQGKIPTILVDEFDSVRQQMQFGWLQQFLAPTWDREFIEKSRLRLGKMIFAFAGSAAGSVDDYLGLVDASAKLRDGDVGKMRGVFSREKADDFLRQKGIDFTSRNTMGIEVSGVNEAKRLLRRGEPQVPSHYLKRAMILRRLLGSYPKLRLRQNGREVLNISRDVAYALLTTKVYRFGSRSLEQIVRASTLGSTETFDSVALPSPVMLKLHVDVDDFQNRLHSTPEWFSVKRK